MSTQLTQQDRWLWPFELTEKLGEGGMGVVYKARYVVNDKAVAVKLLPPDVTDETVLARFEREVEILKTLRHPNIVLCFGGSCENKRRFYAMELVEGGTLDDLLKKRGKLPWELVIEYAKQMCAALGYAHERGVVHRDVKPGNFLLTGDGKLKLSDFGLATIVAGRKVTAAGRTAGTYEYMAPEQISGKELSPRTDLYALGCVLFELLTGRPPFLAGHSAQVLHAHLKTPAPRVVAELPECPPALDRLVSDLLQKNPLDRPASAAEVAAALRSITPSIIVTGAGTGVTNRPTRAPVRDEPVDEAPRAAKPAASAGLPRWWPFLVVGMLGVVTTLGVALWESSRATSGLEETWLKVFREGAPPRRAQAAEVLGQLATRSSHAQQALRDGLQDPDWTVRHATVLALRQTGSAAEPLLPQLKRMRNEEDRSAVRMELLPTIEAIEKGHGGGTIWKTVLLVALLGEAALGVWWWIASRRLDSGER